MRTKASWAVARGGEEQAQRRTGYVLTKIGN